MAMPQDHEPGIQSADMDQIFDVILDCLTKSKQPDLSVLSPEILQNPKFTAVYQQIQDLRRLSTEISKGELTGTVASRGAMISNMKMVQANLRHLTWQSKRIAQGDYSQTLDFLGEISETFNNMTQKLAHATQRLVDQANLDALTGVCNRLALGRFLGDAFDRAKSRGETLSLLLIDIDHFKHINDTYGHLMGDEVLRAVAKRLEKQTRATDCFARYGGEEFVAVLVGADLLTSRQVCERMLHVISSREVVLRGQTTVPVTISIGVSEMQEEDTRYEDILLRSDEAVYDAKAAGRNCYRTKEGPQETEALETKNP